MTGRVLPTLAIPLALLFLASVPPVIAGSVNDDGSLSAVPGSPFFVGDGPVAIAVHPTLRMLYGVSWMDSYLRAFSIAANGALTLIQSAISTICVAELGWFGPISSKLGKTSLIRCPQNSGNSTSEHAAVSSRVKFRSSGDVAFMSRASHSIRCESLNRATPGPGSHQLQVQRIGCVPDPVLLQDTLRNQFPPPGGP
jgi:hypothetical protein